MNVVSENSQLRNPSLTDQINSDGLLYFVYKGPSMIPVLREPELIEIKPVSQNELKKGDIILFRHPLDSINVVHRIIGITGGKFLTQGDNNSYPDKFKVDFEMIIGLVVAAYRGERRRVIYGGGLGRSISLICRLRQKALMRGGQTLSSIYHNFSLVFSPIASLLLPHRLRPRVISYPSHVSPQYQLFVGKKLIGQYSGKNTRWEITPPYRLIVDVRKLPETK